MAVNEEQVEQDAYDEDNQLQSDDTLIDRGVEDILDEGIIPPDRWSPAQGYGNTPAEMERGETIEQRESQREPEKKETNEYWNPGHEPRQVGSLRAGRLVDEGDIFGFDAGISGGAASAEEAAMHILEEDDEIIED